MKYDLTKMCRIDHRCVTQSPVSRRVQKRVDPVDNPAEQPPVQGLGHGVTDVHCLFQGVEANNGLSVRHHTGGRDGFLKQPDLDLEQVSNCAYTVVATITMK